MKKRILILALVATLVVSMLSGCGKTTNDVTSSPTPSPVVDANASGDVEKEDAPVESSKPISDPTAKPTVKPTKEPAQQTSKPQESTAPTSTPTPTPVTTPTPTITISVADLMAKMVASLPQETCALSEMPVDYYEGVYGVNPADFEQVLVYGSMMNVKSNEIILIKAKDASGVAKAKEVLNQRLAALDIQWQHYLPDQYELVKAGSVNSNGLYVALVVADGAKAAVSAFNALTK